MSFTTLVALLGLSSPLLQNNLYEITRDNLLTEHTEYHIEYPINDEGKFDFSLCTGAYAHGYNDLADLSKGELLCMVGERIWAEHQAYQTQRAYEQTYYYMVLKDTTLYSEEKIQGFDEGLVDLSHATDYDFGLGWGSIKEKDYSAHFYYLNVESGTVLKLKSHEYDKIKSGYEALNLIGNYEIINK